MWTYHNDCIEFITRRSKCFHITWISGFHFNWASTFSFRKIMRDHLITKVSMKVHEGSGKEKFNCRVPHSFVKLHLIWHSWHKAGDVWWRGSHSSKFCFSTREWKGPVYHNWCFKDFMCQCQSTFIVDQVNYEIILKQCGPILDNFGTFLETFLVHFFGHF